jgi:hypothetical protein
LYDEVNLRNVKPTSRHISTEEDTAFCIAKLKKGICAHLLLLLAVKIQNRKVKVIKQLSVVVDGIATAQKDDNLLFLLPHSPEEGEEQEEALIGLA